MITQTQQDRLDVLANLHTWTKNQAIEFGTICSLKYGTVYRVSSVPSNMGTYQIYRDDHEPVKPWEKPVFYCRNGVDRTDD